MQRAALTLIFSSLLACTATPSPGAAPGVPPAASGDANAVATPLREAPASRVELVVRDGLDRRVTRDELAASYPVTYGAGLGYDPLTATGVDALQASSLALSPPELEALARRGFVVTDRRAAPHFLGGYGDIYHADLPVYVTADAILYALHAGFDALLARAEEEHLAPALARWLDGARAQVALSSLGASEPAADVDLYLGVAAALLAESPGALDPTHRSLVDRAAAASGPASVTLYGSERVVDFSQFRPRGHYTRSPALARYFRAVVWLGREGLRLTDLDAAGRRVVRRRQVAAAFALRGALTPELHAAWAAIEGALAGAVGEPDDLTLSTLGALVERLGVPLDAADDAAVVAAIDAVRGESPRVAGSILRGGDGATAAQPVYFSALARRYSPDAMALSSVVYDRVGGGAVRRMMPDPLDAAFASLANDHALELLGASLARHDYATDLRRARVLVDAHERAYWEGSLGAGWLHALRALSPGASLADAGTLPAVARTRAWSTRLLQAQMASWAEYRHDTIAYVAQSYTGTVACSYPDGYVDPYPTFYARVERWAETGRRWARALPPPAVAWRGVGAAAEGWFERLGATASTLRAMAEHERTGAPFTAEQVAFLNRAVRVSPGCGAASAVDGWYTDLFLAGDRTVALRAVVADIHTQPTDEAGADVGRVLHVATGRPRMMVVTVENCTGPHAYVGFVSSYFERTTSGYERLDDDAWRRVIAREHPPEVPWLAPLVAR